MQGRGVGIGILMVICLLACKSTPKQANNWSEQQINEWIESSVWTDGLSIQMDKTTNKRLFVKENLANEESWNAAFEFLKNNDLRTLSTGHYKLSPNGTYATVSIYETKEPEIAQYEAHRKFIDIQYVAAGEEYIEVIPLNRLKNGEPYNSEADIIFFEDKTAGDKLFANEDTYFIFFPEDAHKPCLKMNTIGEVKKVVVKIPVSE
jgi:YhcH/YjgK/YiaL family protein